MLNALFSFGFPWAYTTILMNSLIQLSEWFQK